jgi:tetratricopeptide (TPR) repeat protein
MGLGNLYLGKGRLAEAVHCFQNAVWSAPKRKDCQEQLQRALQQMLKKPTSPPANEWQRQVADCTKALRANPRDVATLKKRGRAYMKLEDWVNALIDLGRAERLDPADPESTGLMGWPRAQLGWYERAMADYDRALQKDPGWMWIWIDRGYLEAGKGEWGKAARDFGHVAWLRPPEETQRAPHLYCVVLLVQGRLADYQQTCAEVLERFGKTQHPFGAEVVAFCGLLATLDAKQVAGFLRVAEAAVQKDPGKNATLFTLGALLYRAGQHEAALRRLAEAEKALGKEGSPELLLFRAMIHKRLGQKEQAQQSLRRAVQRIEEDAAGKPAPLWFRREQQKLLRREAEELLRQG